ncbi:unnamed protein product, partial [Urochloa humidicola]
LDVSLVRERSVVDRGKGALAGGATRGASIGSVLLEKYQNLSSSIGG